jgi:gluconolactonase
MAESLLFPEGPVAMPDGSVVFVEIRRGTLTRAWNGKCEVIADEQTLYVTDTFSARVWAYDLASPGEIRAQDSGRLSRLVGTVPGDVYIDGMAVTQSGKLCVATIINGGISTLDPSSGESKHVGLPDAAVTNLCFGGSDLRDAYISMSAAGSVVRIRWPEPGVRLPFTQY